MLCSSSYPPAATISSASGLPRFPIFGEEIELKAQASIEILGLQVSHTVDESQHIEAGAKVSMALIQPFQNVHMLSV